MAHLIVTGVGGINTTNNPGDLVKIRSLLLNHGRDSGVFISIDDAKDKQGKELHTIIEQRFSFVSVGHFFRVTEMESAQRLAQAGRLGKYDCQRRRNAALLTEALKPFDNVRWKPCNPADCEHSFMMYHVGAAPGRQTRAGQFPGRQWRGNARHMPLTQSAGVPQAIRLDRSGFHTVARHIAAADLCRLPGDLRPSELECIVDCIGHYFGGKQTKKPVSRVTLALLADRRSAEGGAKIKAPLGLFARTLVLDNGMPASAGGVMEAKGAKVIEGQGTRSAGRDPRKRRKPNGGRR